MRRICVLLVFLMCFIGFASAADTVRSAADACVPEDAIFQEMEKERDGWEYEYISPDQSAEYTVTVDPDSAQVLQYEFDLERKKPQKGVLWTEEQVESKLAELYEGAEIEKLLLQKDDGGKVYRVWFYTESFVAFAEIGVEDGETLELTIRYRTESVPTPPFPEWDEQWDDRDEERDDDWNNDRDDD